MACDLAQFVDDLKESYAIYYDVHPAEADTGLPLSFRADFHSRGESYFLIKSAKIWASETNEYVYVFSTHEFDEDTVNRCVDYALADGLAKVTPHREHQYSNVHTIFVADRISPEIRQAIKARRFNKSYRMSLHGFSLLKTGFIDLEAQDYGTNREGHDLADFFKKLFSQEQFLKK